MQEGHYNTSDCFVLCALLSIVSFTTLLMLHQASKRVRLPSNDGTKHSGLRSEGT